jgi:hypothetical protein
MNKVNEVSYDVFEKAIKLLKDQSPFGSAPREWLAWVYKHSNNQLLKQSLSLLSDKPVRREDIYQMVTSRDIGTISCVATILAWGGMQRQSGVTALSTVSHWLPVCDEIRGGKLSRIEGYEKLMSIRIKKQMKGMGPAFFTKLIFFLMHGQKNQGYIMDQWTGASVNLLSESELVKVKKQKKKDTYFETIADENTGKDYENFCSYVEYLAEKLMQNPVSVELALFSEGRGKGIWRNYVVASRLK